jgi:hypothetical protein
MKITASILSIPPYLSTTWKNISSLHVREERNSFTLIVLMQNRVQIEVPNLAKETIDEIFEAHARAAEEQTNPQLPSPIDGPFSFSLPIKSEGPIDSLGFAMQHNPENANLEPIPPQILNKITLIARAFGLDDSSALPNPEPDCNCVYCQVARALMGEDAPAEEVKDADLTFRDWEIKEVSDKLYTVTNPLDANEHYNVFLGTPLGCTCGSKNCEHIRAVLKT